MSNVENGGDKSSQGLFNIIRSGSTSTVVGTGTGYIDTSGIYGGYGYTTYSSNISTPYKAFYFPLREEGRKEIEASGHNIDTLNKMLEGTKEDVNLAISILLQYTKFLGRFQDAFRNGRFAEAEGILLEFYTKNVYKI